MPVATKPLLAALALTALGASAVALFQNPKLTVNGLPSEKPPLVQDGETYIPLSALQAAGAEVQTVGDTLSVRFNPLSGMDQLDAIQGQSGEWLNNNLVRVRISNPRAQNGKYLVDLEVSNLAAEPLNPVINLGMAFPELYGPEGRIAQSPQNNAAFGQQFSTRLTQGATGKATLSYESSPGPEGRLIIRFTLNAARERIVERAGGFKKPGPNFRIQLSPKE